MQQQDSIFVDLILEVTNKMPQVTAELGQAPSQGKLLSESQISAAICGVVFQDILLQDLAHRDSS